MENKEVVAQSMMKITKDGRVWFNDTNGHEEMIVCVERFRQEREEGIKEGRVEAIKKLADAINVEIQENL